MGSTRNAMAKDVRDVDLAVGGLLEAYSTISIDKRLCQELGDGNAPEFGQYNCPMVQANRAKDGEGRKGQTLNWNPEEEL